MAVATSPMTPKGFSGVMCRSRLVVVVTALVLMDIVATEVGEEVWPLMEQKTNTVSVKTSV